MLLKIQRYDYIESIYVFNFNLHRARDQVIYLHFYAIFCEVIVLLEIFFCVIVPSNILAKNNELRKV